MTITTTGATAMPPELLTILKDGGPWVGAAIVFGIFWVKIVAPMLRELREDRNKSEERAAEERIAHDSRVRVDNEVLQVVTNTMRDTAYINKATAELNLKITEMHNGRAQ